MKDDIEDYCVKIEDVPFIANKSFVEIYGTSFSLIMKDRRLTVIKD